MPLNRRRFIIRSGASAAVASAGPMAAQLREPLASILTLAMRAPSGHNTQPWTVRVEGREHWIVGIEKSRRLPAVDPTARETCLSLGAFLENLILAAAHHGYGVDYRVIAVSPADADILDLRFRKTNPSVQNLQRIQLRRTVRNGLLNEELKPADLKQVTAYGEGLHYFPKGSAAAKYLAEGTVEANRKQAYREPAEEELADWIRWSAGDAAKHGNGLTPASMEIEGISGWYVSHFFDRSSVLSKSFRDTTIKQVIERVAQGSGWLVLSSADGAVSTLIETGRKMERMWLGLRELKIAIHPMTQMLEEAPWREQVAGHLVPGRAPQFLLRTGYLRSYPGPASVRMPPEKIVRFS